ncbi:MAG: hypothetical protein JSS02_24090 [Planctomycetes bacterium]|nr:hypothetical protein [Planctomycetota bacterium]
MNHSQTEKHLHPSKSTPAAPRHLETTPGTVKRAAGKPSKPKTGAGKRPRKSLSFHRAAERRATMTGHGAAATDVLEIDYSQPEVQIQLTAGGQTLLHGPLATELMVDGKAVTARGDWKAVCPFGDEDGQYLELQLQITDKLRIDRQFFLSGDSHFVLIADAVISEGSASRIQHRVSLPLPANLKRKADVPTREWRLGPARLFPLWLPQERVHSTQGDCVEQGDKLNLSYTVAGPGLYLPTVIDWNPSRRRPAADWCSLTVTEPARVVSPTGAAGHRLRIGSEQLVFYRGLISTPEPRAMLGIHTWHESLFGWFKPNGQLVTLMATDADKPA